MELLDTATISTAAGDYTVRWIYDDSPEQPYDEGFTLAVDGWSYMAYDRKIDIEHGDIPGEVWDVLRTSGKCRNDSWPREQRSGAALVRWLTLKGYEGVTLVDSEYRPVDTSTDRYERVCGVAWESYPGAPNPHANVKSCLEEWQAWAVGDAFGWAVTDPAGNEVESLWGYYGLRANYDYTLSEATDAAQYDAAQRIDAANLVGAGIVGLI